MRVEYQNSTGLLAVIGDPIAHSLSPLLQNAMIRELGMDDLYLAVEVPPDGLGDFVAAAKTLHFEGFNLTMPHKERILPFLSSKTREAEMAGSVNTVRIRDGRLEGHSTDGLGFARALADFGLTFSGQTVAILGAGGAAKSIAAAAVGMGAREVRVLNRTLGRAQALCTASPVMTPLSLAEAEHHFSDVDLLVNTTPVGMTGTEGGAFPFLAALKPGAPALDCIYSPAVTPFMAEARSLGHPVFNGIGMLVYQAIYAYAFFKGLTFDDATVTRLGRLLLEESGVRPN